MEEKLLLYLIKEVIDRPLKLKGRKASDDVP